MSSFVTPVDEIDGEALLPMALCHLHLGEDADERNDLLKAFRLAALTKVEALTGKSLSVRKWKWETRCFAVRMRPPIGPVSGVVSVEYRDANGAAAVLNADDCRIESGQIIAVSPSGWPNGSATTFILQAGYEQPPAPLLAAAQLILGHLFRNREAVITGTIATALPIGVEALCAEYRGQLV